MAETVNSDAGEMPAKRPRPVSRGLDLHCLFLGIDSLYLIVKYPHADVFYEWAAIVPDLYDKRLINGIVCSGGMIVKRGGLGYKLSVWLGDARIFITDRVTDKLKGTHEETQGMGVMLQIGPWWLREFCDIADLDAFKAHLIKLLAAFGLSEPEKYPMRLNRVDVALDVQDLPVSAFSVDEWRNGWVGRASSKSYHDAADTGELTGFSIGSSAGALRFKVYDKMRESKSRGNEGFWRSVWGLDWGADVSVTRFEWTVKPYSADFAEMRYFSEFTFEGLKELMNYATLKWGRLCVPEVDTNQSRWEISPLWSALRQVLVDEWDIHLAACAHRVYHFKPDLNISYLRSVAGWLGGLMARVGIENDKNAPAKLTEALFVVNRESPIVQKAHDKWALFTRMFKKVKHD